MWLPVGWPKCSLQPTFPCCLLRENEVLPKPLSSLSLSLTLQHTAYGHLFSWASCRTHVCTIHLVLILEVLGEQRTYQTRYRQNPDVHLLYYNTCENQKVFKTGWSKFQWNNFRHHDAPWKRRLWYEIRSTL